MATIYEVSKLAGVSLATVSRVMNGTAKVSPHTRRKVEVAMAELGYRPNSIAQSLASSRTNSVGILVPELHGPFFGIMLSNIEDELRRAGKHVIITAGHSDHERERDSIGFLSSRQCDALILHVYSVSNEYLLDLHASGVQCVVIGRDVPGMSENCVQLDDEQGGYLAARHLLELGHRRLAYISGPLWKSDARERYSGHRRALAEYGLSQEERLLAEGNYQEPSGREAMERLLDLGEPFTGLICANDEMAAGATAIARRRGLKLPEELSVIGFDNIFFTRYMHPQLTSINHPIDQIGRMAARCVLRNCYGVEGLEIINHFQPEVISRGSTAPYAG